MGALSFLKRTLLPLPRPRRSTFDHALAQKFELHNNEQVVKQTFAGLYSDVEANLAAGGLWHSENDEFFHGDRVLFDTVIEHIKTRKCLEIGSGPYGFLAPARWIADRTIIEPLAAQYKAAQLREIGKTFFTDDIKVYPNGAETLISELVGKIDGKIMSRNALDHCEDPLTILMNISQYAAPGGHGSASRFLSHHSALG
jgi:hypothetical protein